jgi:hypothetical protein
MVGCLEELEDTVLELSLLICGKLVAGMLSLESLLSANLKHS